MLQGSYDSLSKLSLLNQKKTAITLLQRLLNIGKKQSQKGTRILQETSPPCEPVNRSHAWVTMVVMG